MAGCWGPGRESEKVPFSFDEMKLAFDTLLGDFLAWTLAFGKDILERTVQANQAAQRFASHSPSIFEYASNFYICQADQLEKLSDILEKLSHRYT